jgi:hypothetical protein
MSATLRSLCVSYGSFTPVRVVAMIGVEEVSTELRE